MKWAEIFPQDPHVILDPTVRWYPGVDDELAVSPQAVLPPLVQIVREGVTQWRSDGYPGASATSCALLRWWFDTDHLIVGADGVTIPFRYYFAQREAVESVIWLYEVERARDPYALMKYDGSGQVSRNLFMEDWTRYVLKLATGTGKTKVLSLLIAWSYFHKLYEPGSDLARNFLVLAPNIIVLDRLRTDLEGVRIFWVDPVLPDNGYGGQTWQDDFQLTVHLQNTVHLAQDAGNLFLTNIHRLYRTDASPTFEDADTLDYFLGPRPISKTTDDTVDLAPLISELPDLLVLNDEAHHIHDDQLAWFQTIKDLINQFRLRGRTVSAQIDVTATPKHADGAIFVQTVSDYPLVEAIRQGVVKRPVLPDQASRAKLQERPHDDYAERYADYLHLGYMEWEKVTEELQPTGKKPILFVMTDDTKDCDAVKAYLERRYPALCPVLVIHTKKNGDLAEGGSNQSKAELQKLRELANTIDDPTNPFKAIVSVMVLREGWDVQNVVTIVGLRPFRARSQILPEQALGRGLRRMFRGEPVSEQVSVIGTDAFMDFVERIKAEGVELDYQPMGRQSPPKGPLTIQVDRGNPQKDIDRLDITLPELSPRIYREFKNFGELDLGVGEHPRWSLQQFSESEQREIIFRDIDTEGVDHTTVLDVALDPNPNHVVGYFARTIMRDLRLVGVFDVLFGKLKQFLQDDLFTEPVRLDDLNTLRNLSKPEVTASIVNTTKRAINALTIRDTGTTRIQNTSKLSQRKTFLVKDQGFMIPKKSVFNKVVGDSQFELEFAAFLDGCEDLISFAKNYQSQGFAIEYHNADGGIARYFPDWFVKETADQIWLIETKGREDVDDPRKWDRLQQWCHDANQQSQPNKFRALYVTQERWGQYHPKDFRELCRINANARPLGTIS